MPYKRSNRRVYKGKQKARSSRKASVSSYYKKKLNIQRNASLCVQPYQRYVKMKYGENATIVSTSGIGGYSFRSSIFDPNYTGVGHQPLYHDQLAILYDRYVVVGAKIKATFYPTNTTATGDSGVVGISIDEDTTLPASCITLLEQNAKNIRYKRMRTGSSIEDPNIKTVTSYYSAKRFFGVKDVKDNKDIGAAFGANPIRQAYFTLFAGTFDTTVDTSLQCNVLITFIVLCTKPKDVATS